MAWKWAERAALRARLHGIKSLVSSGSTPQRPSKTTQLRVKQRMSDYHQGSAAAQKKPGGRDRQEEFTHTVSVARER